MNMKSSRDILDGYKNWFNTIPIDKAYNVKLDFAVKIEKALADSGVTKKELAEKMNKSPAWISKILRGDANLTIETMCEITKALDYNIHIHAAPTNVNVKWFDTYKNRDTINDRGMVEAWKVIEKAKDGKQIPTAA